jgi:hypothetical protein
MTLNEAIETIVTSYGDIEVVARSLTVDAGELAIATAQPDTAAAIALALLKKYNMTVPVVVIKEVELPITEETTE